MNCYLGNSQNVFSLLFCLDLAIFSFALQFVSLLRIFQNQYLRWNIPELSKRISEETLDFKTINKHLFKALVLSLISSLILYFVASFIIINFWLSLSS